MTCIHRRLALPSLLLATSLTICACSGKGAAGPSPAPQRTASVPVKPTTASAAVVAGTPQPDLAAVRTWARTAGSDIIKAIDSDIDELAKTPQNASKPPAACRQLNTDVSRMRAALPTPDAALTTELQDAMTHLTESASTCLIGDALTSSIEERLALPQLGASDSFIADVAGGDAPPALPPQTAARVTFEAWGWTRHGFALAFAVHKDIVALSGTEVTVCAPWARDSAALLAVLPSPDAQLTALLRSALAQFAASANACRAGDMATAVSAEASAAGVWEKAEARELAIAGA